MTHFFVVRTARGYETNVAESLAENAKIDDIPLVTVLSSPSLSGCIIVECERRFELIQALRNVKRSRGIIGGKITLEEVMNFIKIPEVMFEEGEIVEIVAGPLKGCKAKVLSDDGGNRVTVAPLEWEHAGRMVVLKDQVRR